MNDNTSFASDLSTKMNFKPGATSKAMASYIYKKQHGVFKHPVSALSSA